MASFRESEDGGGRPPGSTHTLALSQPARRRRTDAQVGSGQRGDPPPVDRPARPLVALEVEIREAPSETDHVARRAHAFERTAEAPPIDDLVDREPPAVGPAYDERVDAPLVGDAGVEADVELSTPGGVWCEE